MTFRSKLLAGTAVQTVRLPPGLTLLTDLDLMKAVLKARILRAYGKSLTMAEMEQLDREET